MFVAKPFITVFVGGLIDFFAKILTFDLALKTRIFLIFEPKLLQIAENNVL